MTTPTPERWTAETKETLHRTLHDLRVRIDGLPGDHHCNLVAEVVLTTLADAGVLTPPGGETRQEVGVMAPPGRRKPRYPHARTVTTWPDGTELTTPWREVADDPT